MQDEPNWRGKPLFQLKSMAQTRACAKALRNVLAWVVVLAGYAPTPSEEMTHAERIPTEAKKTIGQMEMELKELYEDKFFTDKARTDLKAWFENKPGYEAIKEQLRISKELIAKKKKSKGKPVLPGPQDELLVNEADAFDSENPPVGYGPPPHTDYSKAERD